MSRTFPENLPACLATPAPPSQLPPAWCSKTCWMTQKKTQKNTQTTFNSVCNKEPNVTAVEGKRKKRETSVTLVRGSDWTLNPVLIHLTFDWHCFWLACGSVPAKGRTSGTNSLFSGLWMCVGKTFRSPMSPTTQTKQCIFVFCNEKPPVCFWRHFSKTWWENFHSDFVTLYEVRSKQRLCNSGLMSRWTIAVVGVFLLLLETNDRNQ